MQDEIGAWGDATFPNGDRYGVVSHFREEVREFLDVADSIPNNPQYDEAEEAADVFLLLLHFAHKVGFDLETVTERKMAVNRLRTWNTTPEPEGHFKHVKSDVEA